ncbi:MAG: diguanylate cyclase, partial [Gallionellaceae bacterium]|nr:diguanylate cyclase [Gallionellaceae bacterium]
RIASLLNISCGALLSTASTLKTHFKLDYAAPIPRSGLVHGRRAAGALPLIVLTGHNDPEFALQTLEAGAQDYLIKGDFQAGDLIRSIRYSMSRAKLEQRLYEADEMMRLSSTVFNTVDEAILVSDADNRIITVNPAFTRVTGYTPEEVIGGNPNLLSSGKHGTEFYRELWLQLTSQGSWSGEMWNRRKSGEIFVEWTSIKQVRDAHGKLTHYVAAFSDITARKANEESIRHQAQYDALTDLPNRVLLFDRLRQALAQAKRDRAHLALMYIDLDKFKPINDNLGHAIGDQVLQQAASRMQDCVREMDTVARIGGDEFVVLLPVVENEQDALVVAEKIRFALNQSFKIAGQSLNISSSAGIAIYPEHGESENELTGNADIAMYHAKESGRNNVKMFQAAMRDAE